MKIIRCAISALALSVLAVPAVAATLSLTTDGETQKLKNFDLAANAIYGTYVPGGLNAFNGSTIKVITGEDKSAANGLSATGAGTVKYTYLGSEAANKNYAASILGTFFTKATAVGYATAEISVGAGLLDFLFGSLNNSSWIANNGESVGAKSSIALGFSDFFNGGNSIIVFFDDLASGDRDFDDMAMRVDFTSAPPAAVPLPAAGLLMLGALGGLAAMRRRKA